MGGCVIKLKTPRLFQKVFTYEIHSSPNLKYNILTKLFVMFYNILQSSIIYFFILENRIIYVYKE